MLSSFKKVLWGLLLFLAVVLLDQASKHGELFFKIDKIGFVHFQVTTNFALAFSITSPNTVGIFFSIAWLVLAILLLPRLTSRFGRLGMTLMIAGGASNLIDRLGRGGVKDIFVVGGSFFNLADSAILIGAAVVLFGFWARDTNLT